MTVLRAGLALATVFTAIVLFLGRDAGAAPVSQTVPSTSYGQSCGLPDLVGHPLHGLRPRRLTHLLVVVLGDSRFANW